MPIKPDEVKIAIFQKVKPGGGSINFKIDFKVPSKKRVRIAVQEEESSEEGSSDESDGEEGSYGETRNGRGRNKSRASSKQQRYRKKRR